MANKTSRVKPIDLMQVVGLALCSGVSIGAAAVVWLLTVLTLAVLLSSLGMLHLMRGAGDQPGWTATVGVVILLVVPTAIGLLAGLGVWKATRKALTPPGSVRRSRSE